MSETNVLPDQNARALAYLQNEMTKGEREAFEQELTESAALRDELFRARAVLDTLEKASDPPVMRMANAIISTAIERGASDIHIVPERRNVRVNVRLDGVLQELMMIPQHIHQPMVDRWKVMADMNVGERRLPQDGRFPVKHQGKEYDLRVNILPTLHGERVTVRILSRHHALPHLGMYADSPVALEALRRLAKRVSGIILTGGTVGTGKTTLLLALLLEAYAQGRPGRNFLTLEDPIEIDLSNAERDIAQMAINPGLGLTYAAGLRAFRRADPDVVYCAALSDNESAEIIAELAQTGHLVLSALSATSAIGVIIRLRETNALDFEDGLLVDVLAGVTGQRLVRRIDAQQVEEYQPTDEDLQQLGLTRADGPFIRGVPTEANHKTGFAGRLPLLEVVEVTPELRRLMKRNTHYDKLWNAAFPNGVGSLLDDARAKVKAGLTTVEEAIWALADYPRPEVANPSA